MPISDAPNLNQFFFACFSTKTDCLIKFMIKGTTLPNNNIPNALMVQALRSPINQSSMILLFFNQITELIFLQGHLNPLSI